MRLKSIFIEPLEITFEIIKCYIESLAVPVKEAFDLRNAPPFQKCTPLTADLDKSLNCINN